VRELSDEEADAIMLTENVHRVDLNPVDEGHAYSKRIERHGWSVKEVARRANVSEGRVKNRLSLLELRPEAQKLVADGHLALGFAEEMSVLDNNRQLIALRWLQQQKSIPSRRTFAAMVGQLYQDQCQETMFDLDDFFAPGVAEAVQESATGRLCDILPRVDGLPDLPLKQGGIGRVLDEYIATLLDTNCYNEATVVIDLWAKLVGANYANISPYESKALALLQATAA
jgi:ParB-like chromosome segregation protein Spo0J